MPARDHVPYATLAGVFWAGLLGAGLSDRARLPERTSVADLLAVGLAAQKLGRVIAEDRIAVFLRAPVAEGPAAVQPKGRGAQRALGELVTCAHCLSLWICGALTAAQLRRPRETRVVTGALAAYALSDAFGAVLRRAPKPARGRSKPGEDWTGG